MSTMRFLSTLVLAVTALVAGAPGKHADAADPVTITLTIKDHQFSPANVTVPAGQRFRIQVTNQDSTPEEFESHDLKVEKIVAAGATVILTAGPLKPGSYAFVGDYHPDITKGTITAVEAK